MTDLAVADPLPAAAPEPVPLDARHGLRPVGGRVLGVTVPRRYTPPAAGPDDPWLTWWAPRCGCGCFLTPYSSYGFAVVDFARDVLREPLDPWQRWLVIHGGELLEDGRPRFRFLLVMVARQNGKTHLLKTLALYWLFADGQPLVVGTSTNLDYARESWVKAARQAMGSRLCGYVDTVREANGQEEILTTLGTRYKIAAANRRGGRSLTIARLIMDELREHADWSAYDAGTNAMNAVPDAQCWMITNQGDARAVVLTALHADAVEEIAAGATADTDTFLAEYSAPLGMDLQDPRAHALANPNLGRRLPATVIARAARRAARRGGALEAGFRTEVLCQRVDVLNPAIDRSAWDRSADPADMAGLRSRVALCIDVAPDLAHVTVAAAAVLRDGRARLEVVAAWAGARSVDEARRDLPELVARVRPAVVGWLPSGPAAALAADLADRRAKGRPGWPPAGVTVEEIRGEMTAVCMGFAEQVAAGRIAHPGDPLLDDQVRAAEPTPRGDGWVFSRRGVGHVDAVYAAAGAVHLARTLPAPVGRQRLVVVE